MQPIEAILFEPVGCLAEFPSEPFHAIAAQMFGVPKKKPSRSGSRAYWHLLNLMEEVAGQAVSPAHPLELEAANAASIYEDVLPALSELKEMGIRLCVASSLPHAAVAQFVGRHNLDGMFDAVCDRDNAGGIKAIPIRQAAEGTAEAVFLTDTLEGLKTANLAQVKPFLMMNNPDEARRLAMHGSAGGIVSLLELPDFVQLLLSRGGTGAVV